MDGWMDIPAFVMSGLNMGQQSYSSTHAVIEEKKKK